MASRCTRKGAASDQRRMTLKIWRSMLLGFGDANLALPNLDTAG